MLHIALYQPEIPPNTGNIIRLCANTGAQLHLIHPLGFTLEDKQMRRAGLDYAEWAAICHYPSFAEFQCAHAGKRIFVCSTKGSTYYSDQHYQDNDLFLFGQETKGLPVSIREQYPLITLPMQPSSRSLNLSNAAAVILYEAWRQLGFYRGC
jgi:tRNA (cytidine/uridine-2'-O-)-methyltransferase